MGVRLEDIRHGLRTFTSTFYQAPGRLNVYEGHPFTVLFDYAHNADAVTALVDTASRMTVAGRRIMVLSAPGDRRDDDIRSTARAAAAGAFDHYVVRRDDNPRGRGDDEVPRLIAETLCDAGIPRDAVEVVVREPAAIDRALGLAGRGDLVIICADQLERGWRQIEEFGTPAHARGDGATAASASAAGSATALGTAPAAEAVRAHPHDEAPAEDPAPPAPAPAGASVAETGVAAGGRDVGQGGASVDDEGPGPRFVRDTRGVVLAREVGD
jgi:cyanophycin synthetase